MRDLSLSEFSDQLREKLVDEGVNLPRHVVLQLTKAFFKQAEKIAATGYDRFTLWNRDITHVYPIYDINSLCAELADGKDVLTINRLISKKRMQPRVFKRLRRTGSVVDMDLK
jgi:hypothetical protein